MPAIPCFVNEHPWAINDVMMTSAALARAAGEALGYAVSERDLTVCFGDDGTPHIYTGKAAQYAQPRGKAKGFRDSRPPATERVVPCEYRAVVHLTPTFRDDYSDATALRHAGELPLDASWCVVLNGQRQDAQDSETLRDVAAYVNFILGRDVHNPARVRYVARYEGGRRHWNTSFLLVPAADVAEVLALDHTFWVVEDKVMATGLTRERIPWDAVPPPRPAPVGYAPNGKPRTNPKHPVTFKLHTAQNIAALCREQLSVEGCSGMSSTLSPTSSPSWSASVGPHAELPLTPSQRSDLSTDEDARPSFALPSAVHARTTLAPDPIAEPAVPHVPRGDVESPEATNRARGYAVEDGMPGACFYANFVQRRMPEAACRTHCHDVYGVHVLRPSDVMYNPIRW